jgi:hypothetical protein
MLYDHRTTEQRRESHRMRGREEAAAHPPSWEQWQDAWYRSKAVPVSIVAGVCGDPVRSQFWSDHRRVHRTLSIAR